MIAIQRDISNQAQLRRRAVSDAESSAGNPVAKKDERSEIVVVD